MNSTSQLSAISFGFCIGALPPEPIPAPVSFSTDSWATIEAVASSGNARQYYSIGDEKNITLSTGEQVTLQILGFNHDNLTGGGKAGMSIGMKGLLSTTYRMNPTNSNASGWNASEMRNVTLPTIFNQLPVGLQNVIKTVSKQATEGTMSTNLITSQDKLFLFSEYEVTGQLHATEAPIQEGTQYEYWRTVKNGAVSADRIKQLGNTGVAHKWWLRSPRMTDEIRFREVGANGAIWWNSTNQLSAVTFGFCI